MQCGRLKLSGAPVALFGVLLGIAACRDVPGPVSTPPGGLNVSNPEPPAASVASPRPGAALAGSSGSDVAYVSLAPGKVPTGSQGVVRRVGEATSVSVVVTDGGFDPVPVVALAGDSIDVVIVDASGGTALHAGARVPFKRSPVVVRTDPSSGKRDVALNSSLVIVFSEPIDSATLTTSTVQLRKGTTAVPGAVRFVDASDIVAAFDPAAPLDPSSEYQLVITTGIQDRDGQPLAAETDVTFTTGTTLLAAVASVTVAPDCLFVSVGTMAQLVAIPRDANSAVIAGLPATWSTSNQTVATVSGSGLLRALAPGNATLTAVVGGVAGSTGVSVTP